MNHTTMQDHKIYGHIWYSESLNGSLNEYTRLLEYAIRLEK